jgi:hypothetical protein
MGQQAATKNPLPLGEGGPLASASGEGIRGGGTLTHRAALGTLSPEGEGSPRYRCFFRKSSTGAWLTSVLRFSLSK